MAAMAISGYRYRCPFGFRCMFEPSEKRVTSNSIRSFRKCSLFSTLLTVGAKGSGDIHISPDGKFLYASNRLKADGLAIFSIHPENGMLTKVGYQLTGIHPRNFIITPNGKYLLVACRDSNVIQIYERDTDTGLLTDIRKDIKVDKPVCMKFVP